MFRNSLTGQRPTVAAVLAAMVLGALFATVGWVSPAAAAVGACWDTTLRGVNLHVCAAEQWLNAGSSWNFGHARMTMQTDGNLVIYDRRTGVAKWSTRTNGTRANRMYFGGGSQVQNPLILHDTRTGQVPWHSRPSATCAANARTVMALQSDSNFVIYCYRPGTFTAIWASGTVF
jgi:hypothetical protein